jgi:HAE1 family hydrophobic/amphiphilic exporter-1
MINEINMNFAQKVKGAQAISFGPPAIPGLGNGSGFSIMFRIAQATHLAILQKIA